MSLPNSPPVSDQTSRLAFAQRYGFTVPSVMETRKQLHSQFPSIQNAPYSSVQLYPTCPVGYKLKIPDYEYLVHYTNYHYNKRDEEEDEVEAEEEEEGKPISVNRKFPDNETFPLDNCKSSVSPFFVTHFSMTYNPDYNLMKVKGLYDNTPPVVKEKEKEKSKNLVGDGESKEISADNSQEEKEKDSPSPYVSWPHPSLLRKVRRSEYFIRYYNNLLLLKLLSNFNLTKMKSFPYWMTFTPDTMPSTAPDPDQLIQFPLLLKQGVIDEKDKNYYYQIQSYHGDKKKNKENNSDTDITKLMTGRDSSVSQAVEESPEAEFIWKLAQTFDCLHSVVLKDTHAAYVSPTTYFVSLLNQQDIYIASTNGLILNSPRKFHLYNHLFFYENNFTNLFKEYRLLLAGGWGEKEKDKDRPFQLEEQERRVMLLHHYASSLHSTRWARRANIPLPMTFFRFFQIFRHVSLDISRLPNEGIGGTSYGDELIDFANLLYATHGDYALVENVYKKYQQYIGIRKRKKELRKWGRARPLELEIRNFNSEEKNLVVYYAIWLTLYSGVTRCSMMTGRLVTSPSTSSVLFSLVTRLLSFSDIQTIEGNDYLFTQKSLLSHQNSMENTFLEWTKQDFPLGLLVKMVEYSVEIGANIKWWRKANDGGLLIQKEEENNNPNVHNGNLTAFLAPFSSPTLTPNSILSSLFSVLNPFHPSNSPSTPFTFYSVQSFNSYLHPLRMIPFIYHVVFHCINVSEPLDFNEAVKVIKPLYHRLKQQVVEGKRVLAEKEREERESDLDSGIIILNEKKKKKLLALEEPKAAESLKESKTKQILSNLQFDSKDKENTNHNEEEDIESLYEAEEEKKLKAIESAPADQYREGGDENADDGEEDVDDYDGLYEQQRMGQPKVENADELDYLLFPERDYLSVFLSLYYLSLSSNNSTKQSPILPASSEFVDTLIDDLIDFIEKTNSTLPKDEVLVMLECLNQILYNGETVSTSVISNQIGINNPIRSHLISRLVNEKTREHIHSLLHLLCLQNIYSFPINYNCHKILLFYYSSSLSPPTSSPSSPSPFLLSAKSYQHHPPPPPFIFQSLLDIFKSIRSKSRDNNNEVVLLIQLQIIESLVKDGEMYKRFRLPFHQYKLIDSVYSTIIAVYMRDSDVFSNLFRNSSRGLLVTVFNTLLTVLRMENNMGNMKEMKEIRSMIFHLCRRFVTKSIKERAQREKKGIKDWNSDDFMIYKGMAICLFFAVIPITENNKAKIREIDNDGLYDTREQEELARFILVNGGKEEKKEKVNGDNDNEKSDGRTFKVPSFPTPSTVPPTLSSRPLVTKSFISFIFNHRYQMSTLIALFSSDAFTSLYTQFGTMIKPPGATNNPSASSTPTSANATKKMDFVNNSTIPSISDTK